MTITCNKCSSSINSRRDNSVFCSMCKKQFHSTCVSKSTEFFDLLNKIRGLSWKCDICLDNYESEITKIIEEKILGEISALKITVDNLKSELTVLTENNQCHSAYINNNNKTTEKPKYADILKNKTSPAVIIHPKDPNQDYSKTKSDLLEKVNPASSNINLSKVVSVKNGGLLISCSSKDDNEKFKQMVQKNLPDSYVIKTFSGVNPRVRVVGISSNYQVDELLDCILKCNSSIFSTDSECKVIKFSPTKKNKDVFQATLQIDKVTYEKISRAGNIFVNYDSCKIFDAFDLLRCFKCNEYHHSASKCSNPLSCPRCGENHDLKACNAKTLTCPNCRKYNLKNTNNVVDIDHAAWDTVRCFTHKQACSNIKSSILSDL